MYPHVLYGIVNKDNLDNIKVIHKPGGFGGSITGRITEKRMFVRGIIRYRNGDGGYLSGEIRATLGLYTVFFFIYGFLTIFWCVKINLVGDNISRLHLLINVCVLLTMFECLFEMIHLNLLDHRGMEFHWLGFLGSFLEVARTTVARWFTVLVSMGYFTLVHQVSEHHNKITLVLASYAVCKIASLVVEDIRHNRLIK